MSNKFIFIGDSLTFGYGLRTGEGWVNNINKYLPFQIINKGINGDTTASMLNRFYSDVTSINPDKVFIMGGTNDLLRGQSVPYIITNIEAMINDIEDKEIYLGIPPCIIKEMAQNLFMPSTLYSYCTNTLPLLRDAIIKLANKYNISYIDFYSLSIKNINQNIFNDGIHLNAFGNDLMLKEFLNHFTP